MHSYAIFLSLLGLIFVLVKKIDLFLLDSAGSITLFVHINYVDCRYILNKSIVKSTFLQIPQDIDNSRVAQWKRAGPITQRSEDRNYALLKPFLIFTFLIYLYNIFTEKYKKCLTFLCHVVFRRSLQNLWPVHLRVDGIKTRDLANVA